MGDQQDDSLNLLLDELEVKARQRQNPSDRTEREWVCQRRYPRNAFRAACHVHFFPQGSSSIGKLTGRTRNLSRTGVGLLVRRVFQSGEPVEVEIVLPNRASMYVAGLVTFCRYAGRGYHEIGVFLREAGSIPIFSSNPVAAMEARPWLRPQELSV